MKFVDNLPTRIAEGKCGWIQQTDVQVHVENILHTSAESAESRRKSRPDEHHVMQIDDKAEYARLRSVRTKHFTPPPSQGFKSLHPFVSLSHSRVKIGQKLRPSDAEK